MTKEQMRARLEEIKLLAIKSIDEDIESLLSVAYGEFENVSMRARCPGVQRVIELSMMDNGPFVQGTRTYADKLSDALGMLVYGIAGDIGSPKNPDFIGNLHSFIANFFFDDAYFSVIPPESKFDTWEAVGDNNGTQDPQTLLDAAAANVKHYEETEEFWEKP